jgi:hypothetical protein
VAYALVGSLGAVSATLSPSFGQATAAGHLLVAWLASNDSGATDPWSTSSPGWTIAGGFGGAFEWTGIAYKGNCAAGETAPSFASSGTPSSTVSMLGEFSGGATSSPLDQTGNGGEGGGSDQAVSCSAPDGQGGDLIVTVTFWNGGATTPTITTTMADTNGSAVTAHVVNNSGGANPYYDFAWGIAGATLGASGDSLAATLSGFSNGGCGIASFKPAVTVAATGRSVVASQAVKRSYFY